MSIQFKIDVQPQYVRLICQGYFNKDAALDLFDEALEIAMKRGRNAVLVDINNLKGAPPSLLDRFYLGSSFAAIQQGKEKIVAMVVVGEEPLIDRERFGEMVAINRGAVGKVFTDDSEAVAWLESKVQQDALPR
jgi:hypothetical protein